MTSNKVRYMATQVACEWAGAMIIYMLIKYLGRNNYVQNNQKTTIKTSVGEFQLMSDI